MMNKIELPLHALRSQISSAIDVVIQVTRFTDGRRALTQISEVLPLGDDARYKLQDMFLYELSEGQAGRSENLRRESAVGRLLVTPHGHRPLFPQWEESRLPVGGGFSL